MIIDALCRYYDILASESRDCDSDAKVSSEGYSMAKVSFEVALNTHGEIISIVDLMQKDGKKTHTINMCVPYQKSRSGSKAPAYFLCDNVKYVFGIEFDKDCGYKLKNEQLNAFKEFQHVILDSVSDNTSVKSFLNFLDAYENSEFITSVIFNKYKDLIFSKGNCVFSCNGEFLHEIDVVKDAWENYFVYCNSDESILKAQNLVNGKVASIAKVHQTVKGVLGAQASGARLVSFNERSSCSYNKDQAYNAAISNSDMIKYTKALNYLLSSKDNKFRMSNDTIIFWADESSNKCASNFGKAINNDYSENSELNIKTIISKINRGERLTQIDVLVNPETKFYILSFSPNNGRLSIRYWYEQSFKDIIEKVAQYHIDMSVTIDKFDMENNAEFIPFRKLVWAMLTESERKKVLKGQSEPDWMAPVIGQLFRSVLSGGVYPATLYYAALRRAHVTKGVNRVLAGFIKAYLVRLSKFGLLNHSVESFTVSLDEDNLSVSYRLGRLFAVLEKAQKDANDRCLNSTIADKFFSSAASTPAAVFPTLLKLSKHHISKAEYGYTSDNLIGQIMSEIKVFPVSLNLEDQGLFMLGYYHQKKAFYTKRSINTEKETIVE